MCIPKGFEPAATQAHQCTPAQQPDTLMLSVHAAPRSERSAKQTWARTCMHRLRHQTFQSLHTRNYRLFFTAQAISRSGLWIQFIAENWLVIRLGGSGLVLGLTTALHFLPLLLFGAYAGVWVDRWNKHTVLRCTQSAVSLLACTVGLLTLTGHIQIWILWVAAFLRGCINALDTPAQDAFTMELVGPAQVTNAVALNNAVRTSARMIGPAIAGLLVSSAGLAACFLINALAYAVGIVALQRMQRAALYTEGAAPRQRGQVWEGLRYVWEHPTRRTVLLIMTLVSTFGLNFQVLLPLLTTHTFQQGVALYGLLMACLGVGAVVGSLLTASWHAPTVRRVAALALLFGVTQVAVAGAPHLTLGFLTIGVMGMASSMFLASCAGCLQLHTGERLRGRVMALYAIAFLGTAPIGGPLVGWLAQCWGPRAGFLVAAFPCITASGLVFLARSQPAEPVPDGVG